MKPENSVDVWAAIAYTVGDIVGSGIFVSPSVILSHSGSVGLSLIIWSVSAVIASFGALCYIELGTTIRKSGCDFAYLSYAGWHPVAAAFLFVSCVLTYPSILAIQTVTFGEYIVNGFHRFLDVDPDWEPALKKLIGFSVLLPLMALNFFSLRKVAAKFQIAATVAKLLVICIIVVTGFYHLIFKGQTENFDSKTVFDGSTSNTGDMVLALYAGLFAYNGWDILNFGTEEIENPRRTLPLAAFFGILISAITYLSMNVAYFSVLTVDEFRHSDTVAVKFAEKTLGDFQYVVPFLIGVMLLGNLNSTIFGSSRYLFAGGVAAVMPKAVGCVHEESGSPRAAILVEVIICVGVSFIGDLDSLISYMTFAMWMQRTMTQIAFIYMRFSGRLPRKPTSNIFRVPILVPIIFLILCVALLVIPVVQHFKVGIYGVGLAIIGLLTYMVFIYPKEIPEFLHKINDATLKFFQILLNVQPEHDVEIEEEKERRKSTIYSERSTKL
ncbi:unnamed protein product, partial [Mesorhabditis spiculigera]